MWSVQWFCQKEKFYFLYVISMFLSIRAGWPKHVIQKNKLRKLFLPERAEKINGTSWLFLFLRCHISCCLKNTGFERNMSPRARLPVKDLWNINYYMSHEGAPRHWQYKLNNREKVFWRHHLLWIVKKNNITWIKVDSFQLSLR